MTWGTWERAQGVNLASRFPRCQANWASTGCRLSQEQSMGAPTWMAVGSGTSHRCSTGLGSGEWGNKFDTLGSLPWGSVVDLQLILSFWVCCTVVQFAFWVCCTVLHFRFGFVAVLSCCTLSFLFTTLLYAYILGLLHWCSVLHFRFGFAALLYAFLLGLLHFSPVVRFPFRFAALLSCCTVSVWVSYSAVQCAFWVCCTVLHFPVGVCCSVVQFAFWVCCTVLHFPVGSAAVLCSLPSGFAALLYTFLLWFTALFYTFLLGLGGAVQCAFWDCCTVLRFSVGVCCRVVQFASWICCTVLHFPIGVCCTVVLLYTFLLGLPLQHCKNCSGTSWGTWERVQGVNLASRFPRSLSNWASTGCSLSQDQSMGATNMDWSWFWRIP